MDDELKNEVYDDIEIVFENDAILFAKILSFPAGKYFGSEWFIKTLKTYNPFSYTNDDDIYFIVDKKNPGATWTIYIEGNNDVDIRSESGRHETTEELEEAFPEIFSYIKNIIGPTNLYECLLLIREGKKVSDSLIDKFDSRVEININSSKPEKSRVLINFDSIDDFVRTVLKEDDIFYVGSILERDFDSISDDLVNKYFIDDDWDEGYVIEYYFSEQNKKLLNKILLYVAPNLYNSDNYKEISTIFDVHFDSSDITYELWEKSYEAKAEKEYKQIKSELCDTLSPYKVITIECFDTYVTSTDNLIKLMEKYGTEKNFSDIFNYIYQDVMDLSGYYENRESDGIDIDMDSFNSFIEDQLDSILSKLDEESDLEDESSLEGYRSISNFRKELSNILSKFSMNKIYNLKGKEFKIESIDEETKKLIVYVYGSGKRSYTPEEFNDFLYNLELFESIVRKIKNNLLY